jgi:hypothetical protein
MEVNEEVIRRIEADIAGLVGMVKTLTENPLDRAKQRTASIKGALETRDRLTISEIMAEFRVSKTYGLELMREVCKHPDYQFVKGSPHKPSYLLKRTTENEAEFISNLIRAEFNDKPIGATMNVAHVANSHNVTDANKLQDIVSRVVRVGSPIKLAPVENPLTRELAQRRLIKFR